MNYTKTIRNYLKENKDKIFDMGYEYKENFYMVPYNTYFKILQRLEIEGLIKTIDRGTYYIGDYSEDITEVVISHYAKEGCGTVLGLSLLNELGLSNLKEDRIRILTCKIDSSTKHIGKIELIKYDALIFTSSAKAIISALEMIKLGYKTVRKLEGTGFYILTMNELCKEYDDFYFYQVVANINYSYSIYITYMNMLNLNKIKNNVKDIALGGIDVN